MLEVIAEKGQFWAALLAWFAAQLFVQLRVWRLRSPRVAAALSAAIFLASCAAVGAWAQRQPSLYREFGVQRCASYSQVGSRFKQLSRALHPDSAAAGQLLNAFSAVAQLKEKLLNSAFRLFYDKFNAQLEVEDVEHARVTALYRHQIQAGILEYMHTLFFWIFALFAVSKLRRNLAALGHLLKVVLAKSFALVCYLFAQDVYSCSALDRLFPHATIYQQLYLAEFVFAALLALVWVPLEQHVTRRNLREHELVLRLQRGLGQGSDAPTQKLRSTIARYVESFKLVSGER